MRRSDTRTRRLARKLDLSLARSLVCLYSCAGLPNAGYRLKLSTVVDRAPNRVEFAATCVTASRRVAGKRQPATQNLSETIEND